MNPPVVPPCLACEGRCVAHDVVDLEDGRQRLHRTVCPMCRGRGVIDYANLPVKENSD